MSLSCWTVTAPILTSSTSTTGTSNAIPNTMNIVSTKLKYLSMSVAIVTPTGVKSAKNLNAIGNTMKYANDIPTKKSSVLLTSSGTTSLFSCWYRPGATNAHIWYSTYGSAIMNATSIATFTGTKNVVVTSVAIIVAPAGSTASSGCARKL